MIEPSPELPPTPPPGALELATSLSVATRIEPELIRAVRLGLHPHLDVGAEADLWFCHWVSVRTHDAIALMPQCLPYLRARLARSLETDPRMSGVFEIISEYHHGLSPALVLEEQITWHTVIGEQERADQHLHRALHALVRQNRTGVAGWFADAWQRIPAEARTTAAAWSLANATRSHVPSLDPGQGPEVTLTDVATIAAAVGETRLGVRREGTDLLLGSVQGADAVAILVPDTSPRLVEVTTARPLGTVRIEDGATARIAVGTGPLSLRTGAGQIYRIDAAAVAARPPKRREWEVLLNLLGQGVRRSLIPRLIKELTVLVDKYLREDDDTSLGEAVQLGDRALQAGYAPDRNPDLGLLIAEVMRLEGVHYGLMRSLTLARDIGRDITRGATGAIQLLALLTLGRAQRDLFGYTGEISDLEQSQDALRGAVTQELERDGDPREAIAEELRTVLLHYESDPQPQLLSRAARLVSMVEERVGSRPPMVTLIPLAQFRLRQYSVSADSDDLDQAETLVGELMRSAGVSGSVRAEGLAVRASAALLRARRGERSALDSALSDLRSAVSLVPVNRVLHSVLRASLGNALRLRFQLLGRTRDLTDAQRELQAVVKRGHHLARWHALGGLSRCQLIEFRRTGEHTTLERALESARETFAIGGTSRTSPWHRAVSLTHLADSLTIKFRLTGDPGLLDEAVDALESALRDLRTHPTRAATASALAATLLERHTLSANPYDLTAAIEELESVLRATFQGNRPTVEAIVLMATAIERSPDASDSTLRNAVNDMAAVAGDQFAPPLQRLKAALVWGSLGLRLDAADVVIRGYEAATAEIPGIILLPGSDHAELVRRWESLGREATSYAIETAGPRRAVEILEHQLALLAAWDRNSRTESGELTGMTPSLAEELRWLWALIDLDTFPPEPSSDGSADSTGLLAVEMSHLIRSITTHPSQVQIFAPPGIGQLLKAASDGPVVVLNASTRRCDALLINERSITVTPLLGVDRTSLEEMAEEYASASTSLTGRDLAVRSTGPDSRSFLNWLWHRVVQQILDDLGLTGTRRFDHRLSVQLPDASAPDERLSRIWWCPTGPFTRLPLHAAGVYDIRPPRTAMEYAVHSYTPSVRALQDARIRDRHTVRAPETRMLLVLGDPGELPHAAREIAQLHRLIPESTLLRGPEATSDRVLAALPEHPFFHYSGHASHREGPAGLHLHDHRLTPRDIRSGVVVNGALAYLSACETNSAPVGSEHPSWTVAAAFQSAGYRHVIAALGQISDRAAGQVALEVYRTLLHENTLHPERTARALHHALRQLPTDRPDDLLTRASLVHLGP